MCDKGRVRCQVLPVVTIVFDGSQRMLPSLVTSGFIQRSKNTQALTHNMAQQNSSYRERRTITLDGGRRVQLQKQIQDAHGACNDSIWQGAILHY